MKDNNELQRETLHEVQQPRLAAEAVTKNDIETRARTEYAAVDEKLEGISSAEPPAPALAVWCNY